MRGFLVLSRFFDGAEEDLRGQRGDAWAKPPPKNQAAAPPPAPMLKLEIFLFVKLNRAEPFPFDLGFWGCEDLPRGDEALQVVVWREGRGDELMSLSDVAELDSGWRLIDAN